MNVADTVRKIYLAISGKGSVADGTAIQVTAGYSRATGAGTVSGARSATIVNIGGVTGTVMGVDLESGHGVSWSSRVGFLSDIDYDATGTVFAITTEH